MTKRHEIKDARKRAASRKTLNRHGRSDNLATRAKRMADPNEYLGVEEPYRRVAIIRDTSRVYWTL